MQRIQNYLSTVQQTIDQLPVELIDTVVHLLIESRLKKRQIFVMGNGGSASTATHFAADLGKNTRHQNWPAFRVSSLTDNVAAMTAYGNDEGYENIFVQQLASFVQRDDVVIAISASGNSPNVIKAIELANQVGAVTVGLTGFTGGLLGPMADYHLHVPSDIIEQVEDLHLMIDHIIVRTVREITFEYTPESYQRAFGQLAFDDARSQPSVDALYSLLRDLEGQVDPRQLLHRTLQVSLESVGASSGSIVILDECGEVSEAALLYDGRLLEMATPALTETVQHGLARWVVENRQAALVSSTADDPRWLRRSWEDQPGASRSAISVPVMSGDRVAGVMTLAHPRTGQFTQEDLVLLASLAVCLSFSSARILANAASRHMAGD